MRRTTGLSVALAALLLALLAPAARADVDTDGDGLSDQQEAVLGTDPNDDDSDDDSLLDGDEIDAGTDPLAADTDGDGDSDSYEIDHSTDPLVSSSGLPQGTGSPTHTGYQSGIPFAWSGESPQDGVGVYVHSGAQHLVLAVLDPTKGRGLDLAIPILHNTQSTTNGFVGLGNTSLFDWKLTVQEDDDVDLVLPDGIERTFTWSAGTSTFTSPLGCTCILTKVSTGVYERTFPTASCAEMGVHKYRFSSGRLQWMEDLHGNRITVTWESGKPTTLTDSRGLDHTVTCYTNGRFWKVADPDGFTWELIYNTKNELHQVLGPATSSYATGILTEFRYVNGATTSALNGNLSSAYDGRGHAWLRNQYDTSDRVKRQYVRGSSYFAFDYANIASESVTVTDRMGNTRVWGWDETLLTRTSLVENTNRNVRSGEGNYTTTWTHDDAGYMETTTYPRGNGVTVTLNDVKLPTEVRRQADMAEDPDDDVDLIDTYTYDDTKFYGMTSHTDPCQDDPTYTLNAKGQPTATTYETVTHTDPDVTVTTYAAYDAATGLATSTTDGEGGVTTYEYYTTGARKGRLKKKIVDAGGLDLTTEYDYENWGSLKSVTDPRGNTTTTTVERYGNVEEVAAPTSTGYVTRYDYNENLDLIEQRVKNIDWDGSVLTSPVAWWTTTTTWGPYTIQQVEETDGSNSRFTTYENDANENTTKVTRAGREVRMLYDERDLLYKRTRELGTTDPVEEWTYDGNRNVIATINPRGKSTTFEYDLFDRRTKTTNALGHYEELVYSPAGNVLERKSYEGGTTPVLRAHHKSHFDEMGRLWQEEDALLGTTTTWYARTFGLDKRGLLTSLTDRRSYETTFAYDGAGRRTSTTDPIGNVSETEFDDNGNATAVEETDKVPGSGSTETYRTEMEYDVLNRLKKRTEIDRTNSSNTKVTEWKRSVLGLRKTIDAKGNEVLFTLDGYGRVTQKSEDMGSSAAVVTQWDYLITDDVSVLRDDNGHETSYDYDGLGRLHHKAYENAKTVDFTYDLNGNVTRIEDQNGTLIDQGFDDLDRLTGREITPGTGVGGDTTEDFAYDALNRLSEASDDDSVVQFTYDSLSRVLTEVQGSNPLSTTGKTVTYTWDAESNRTKIDYPSGFDANEARDSLGRITAITDGSSATVASFDLYGAGLRRKKVTLANGTYAATTYDGFRRPTEIAHRTSGNTQFAGFSYAWDPNDNPLMEARSHQSGAGDVYTYDKANRLTKVLRDVADPVAELATPNSETYVNKLEYDMDDVFNLTAYKVTPYGGSTTTTSYTTNAMNEYTAVGSQTPTYTDAGSLANDDTFTYKYDAHQHLIEVKQGATVIATYRYDALGLGRRTGKTVGAAVTRYVYAGQQSIEEYDGTGSGANLSRLFVFGEQIDQIVAMEAPDVADVDSDSNTTEVLRFSFHTQLIGSVSHVTGPSQSIVESYLYDPYGKPTIKDAGGSTISASAIKNPYLFTGRQLDEETGLYYYRARQYSPELRRFVQLDPSDDVEATNLQSYVGSSPVLYSDPEGLDRIRFPIKGAPAIDDERDEPAPLVRSPEFVHADRHDDSARAPRSAPFRCRGACWGSWTVTFIYAWSMVTGSQTSATIASNAGFIAALVGPRIVATAVAEMNANLMCFARGGSTSCHCDGKARERVIVSNLRQRLRSWRLYVPFTTRPFYSVGATSSGSVQVRITVRYAGACR